MDREQAARKQSAYESSYNSALQSKGWDLAKNWLDDPYFVLGTILDIANKHDAKTTGDYVKAILVTLVDLEAEKQAPNYEEGAEIPVNVRR